MTGRLLGRLGCSGWRDGDRADKRWAKHRDERQWQRDAADELADSRKRAALLWRATLIPSNGAGLPLTQPARPAP